MKALFVILLLVSVTAFAKDYDRNGDGIPDDPTEAINEELAARTIYMKQYNQLSCGFPWIQCKVDSVREALDKASEGIKILVDKIKLNNKVCPPQVSAVLSAIQPCAENITNQNLKGCFEHICLKRNLFPELVNVCSKPGYAITLEMGKQLYASWALPIADGLAGRCR